MNEKHEGDKAAGAARWLVSTRVPVWTLLLAVVVIGLGLGAVVLQQRMSSVDFGPAVAGAEEVEVRIVMCNAEVDRRGINPRSAELDLEDTLTDEGAEEAEVRVERRDCPDDDRASAVRR